MTKPITPRLTVDCVALDPDGRVLLIRRAHAPFAGALALPGGFVDEGETVEEACRRELLEETGLVAGRLQLVGVYSTPGRDPRGATCSIAFLARMRRQRPQAGDDASSAQWVTSRGVALAFDHRRILQDAMMILQGRSGPKAR